MEILDREKVCKMEIAWRYLTVKKCVNWKWRYLTVKNGNHIKILNGERL